MSDENIFEEFKAAARFVAKIQITIDELIIKYRNKKLEKHLFRDLKKVHIITTDKGPFEDDVFWLMLFEGIIMIPQGVPGENQLLEKLQTLPEFDNEAVIKAMVCSENDSFLVWEKLDTK